MCSRPEDDVDVPIVYQPECRAVCSMARKSFQPGDVVKVAALKDAPEMVVAGGGMMEQVKCLWFTNKGRVRSYCPRTRTEANAPSSGRT
jgi:uncharacterized protein YodC (DUF2158 family)